MAKDFTFSIATLTGLSAGPFTASVDDTLRDLLESIGDRVLQGNPPKMWRLNFVASDDTLVFSGPSHWSPFLRNSFYDIKLRNLGALAGQTYTAFLILRIGRPPPDANARLRFDTENKGPNIPVYVGDDVGLVAEVIGRNNSKLAQAVAITPKTRLRRAEPIQMQSLRGFTFADLGYVAGDVIQLSVQPELVDDVSASLDIGLSKRTADERTYESLRGAEQALVRARDDIEKDLLLRKTNATQRRRLQTASAALKRAAAEAKRLADERRGRRFAAGNKQQRRSEQAAIVGALSDVDAALAALRDLRASIVDAAAVEDTARSARRMLAQLVDDSVVAPNPGKLRRLVRMSEDIQRYEF